LEDGKIEKSTTEVKVEDIKKTEEDTRTPTQKVQDILKPYTFIQFDGKQFAVNHDELKAFLIPKTMTMGDVSARGRLLAAYNGGASNIDPETLSVNISLATISVGFENLKIDLNGVKDVNLIDALYLAIKFHNAFFRSVPIGITL
jgi:hypothetical protein